MAKLIFLSDNERMSRDNQTKIKDRIIVAILIVMITVGVMISFGGNEIKATIL
jgi:hypothetical protein